MPKEPESVARVEPIQPRPRTERIGEILRNKRMERGDDLYAIAEYLRIKPDFLVALENSQYDKFPADAYVVGFLRSYADLLGVNGKDAVERYRYEMAGRRKEPVLAMPAPLSEGRAPSAIILVGATIVGLLIYALWYGISSSNRAEVNAPPVLPTAQQAAPAAAGLTAPIAEPVAAPAAVAPEPAAPPPAPGAKTTVIPPAAPGIVLTGKVPQPVAEPSPASAPSPAPEQAAPAAQKTPAATEAPKDDTPHHVYGDANEASALIIRATQSSWIMVTDSSGKTVFDHVLKPGDSYKVPNRSGLRLTTGNAAGIILSLNGTDLPKIDGGAPHVVRDVNLDPDHLTAATPAQ